VAFSAGGSAERPAAASGGSIGNRTIHAPGSGGSGGLARGAGGSLALGGGGGGLTLGGGGGDSLALGRGNGGLTLGGGGGGASRSAAGAAASRSAAAEAAASRSAAGTVAIPPRRVLLAENLQAFLLPRCACEPPPVRALGCALALACP